MIVFSRCSANNLIIIIIKYGTKIYGKLLAFKLNTSKNNREGNNFNVKMKKGKSSFINMDIKISYLFEFRRKTTAAVN